MSARPPSFPPSAPTARAGTPVTGTDVVTREPAAPRRVSDQLTDRLAERQRARRRLRIRALVIGLVAVLVIGAGGYLALASSVLALETDEVTVVGTNEIVAEQDVLEVVEPLQGTPLLRLDTRGLRADLLDLPGVLDAAVARDLPHGLTITLTPRVPVATVKQDDGYVLLDADGVELLTVEGAPEGVPVVTVPVGTSDTAASLAAVLSALEALTDVDLLEQVTDATAASPYEVELTLDDGATVIWGSAADSPLKASVLDTLLAQVDAGVYDVSAPLSPITR